MSGLMLPYGHQSISDDDIEAVVRTMKSDWLTQGPTIDAFERELAEQVEAAHAVAFSSGTAALHGAAAAAGLGPGRDVLTSPLSFVASANCALYVGAQVNFADIDAETLNLSPAAVARADAAVVVHFAGLPVPLNALDSRPSVLIEDASHALGSYTPYGPVGNCAYSDMCVFSFHPVKTITCGEGGAVTTNNAALAEALRRFRNHGMVRPPDRATWYYEIDMLAYNYRLSDIHAALGLSQLSRLGRFVQRRNELAASYRNLLSDLPVQLPPPAPSGYVHAYHLFPVQVANRDRVFERLRASEIGVQVHYLPIYRHPLHWREPSFFPATEAVFSRILSLPLFPTMTTEDQLHVVKSLKEAMD